MERNAEPEYLGHVVSLASGSFMTTPTTTRGLVLVTGGSGYIAGYCIAQLLSDGWRFARR
jgi:hypothetical protein